MMLRDATRSAADAFAGQLRSVNNGSTPVPNLDWTVADLGAHVAALPAWWRTQHDVGRDFERPDDFAAMSDGARAHITETDPAALADLVDAEYDQHLDTVAQGGTYNLYGRSVTAENLTALALSELVFHGRDLAAVTSAQTIQLTRDQANAIVDATMAITPVFVDPDRARTQPDGTYHLSFRGGKSYTWTKAGDELVIAEGKPTSADAHLNADPVTFMATSLGRMSLTRGALTGGTFTYGRKPWRFLGLGKIVADGV